MIDKNKVLFGLDCCIHLGWCKKCPYHGKEDICTSLLAEDALKLIRYQDNYQQKKEEDNNDEDILRSEWY